MAWAILETPAQIVASRVLTGVCYAGLTVAMVLTMEELLPSALQATGQTLYQATAIGLGSIGGSAAGGLLYGSAGPRALFVFCAAIGLAGALVGWLALPARARRVNVPPDLEDVVVPRSPVV